MRFLTVNPLKCRIQCYDFYSRALSVGFFPRSSLFFRVQMKCSVTRLFVMEPTLNLWLTIIACGAVSFLIRFSFIAIHGRVPLPNWFTRALMFVPVALLPAFALPEILIQNGGVNFSPFNARLIAGIVAVVVAWRTKNVLATIAVGMLVLFAAQFLVK